MAVKMRHPSSRKPKGKMSNPDIVKEISERTGFAKKDIREVLLVYFDLLYESMMNKLKVSIPKIGLLYPTIRRGKISAEMGNESKQDRSWSKSRWVLRLQPNQDFHKELKKLEITEEDEKYIFYKY